MTVKKKSPNVLMIVNLFSPPEPGYPEGIRNNLYLSNYATIQLRDELARLHGVGDITYLGSATTACGSGWTRRKCRS